MTKRVEIYRRLREMHIGHCGQMYGCLVWRVGENSFVVGKTSINIYQTGETLDHATDTVWDITENRDGIKPE
jgi:hypothetical protein